MKKKKLIIFKQVEEAKGANEFLKMLYRLSKFNLYISIQVYNIKLKKNIYIFHIYRYI